GFGPINPKGLFRCCRVELIPRSGFNCVVVWSVEICRSQESGLPLLRYRFLFVYVLVTVLGLFCSKSFYACCLFGGCWHVGFGSVLAVDPYAKF
ncbi:hypothetical protein L195_g037937, partial [Trifolium pratense]